MRRGGKSVSSPRTTGGWLARLAVLLVFFAFVGCCITPPPAEKYFDRTTPHQGLRMFQYSVETRQFETAYACLTPATQEKIGPLRFELILRYNYPVEQWEDLGLEDFVVRSRLYPHLDAGPDRFGPGSYGITAVHDLPGDDDTPVELELPMATIDGEWYLDLLRLTLQE